MDEVQRLESFEHKLANEMLKRDIVEMDKLATTFNYLYKIIRDHKVRIEEIENTKEIRFG